jgi:2-polyprenyl-3-methyl-5-hydroxy-6-metoxy-1,4-benzoquinol methylase
MNQFCQFCRSDIQNPAYEPGDAGTIGVFICPHCGLVQSRRDCSASRAAGNEIRIGRAAAAIEPIAFYADLNAPLNVLDVGAGRGAFVRAFLAAAPHARITAVEADPHRAWACAFQNRSEIVVEPIEETSFKAESFDIIYSAALDCLDTPAAVLSRLRHALKPQGLLVVDTRNIAALREEGVVEEWFASSRQFHFSSRTLIKMIRGAGFEIVERPDREDRENILIVAVKNEHSDSHMSADPMEVHSARALIAFYEAMRNRNLTALSSVTQELNRMAPRGMALWGDGPLFDSLTKHGGLDPAIFSARLGSNAERCGFRALGRAKPEIIVVISDNCASEIGRFAAEHSPESKIVHYSELLFRAYRGLAA